MIIKLLNRNLISIIGIDSFNFLQGLITCDLNKLMLNNIYPSLFLSSNGRIQLDSLIFKYYNGYIIDCNINDTSQLMKILNYRKLSANVEFNLLTNFKIYTQLNDTYKILNNHQYDYQCKYQLQFNDLRHHSLGQRLYDIQSSQSNESTSEVQSTPPEVTTTVPLGVEPSSNYLSLKSKATPGDRGGGNEEEQKVSTRKNVDVQPLRTGNLPGGTNVINPEERETTGVTSGGQPAADLREAEGEINREGSTPSGTDVDWTSGGDDMNGLNIYERLLLMDCNVIEFVMNKMDLRLLPHDLNLMDYGYLYSNKGCYIGQEIINRINNKTLMNKYKLALIIDDNYFKNIKYIKLNENIINLLKNTKIANVIYKNYNKLDDYSLGNLIFNIFSNDLYQINIKIHDESIKPLIYLNKGFGFVLVNRSYTSNHIHINNKINKILII